MPSESPWPLGWSGRAAKDFVRALIAALKDDGKRG